MQLYYFTSLKHGLAAIRDKRLKISKFSELNDPADHIGIFVSGVDNRKALRRQRQRFDAGGGILCMSFDWREPLLWGHYADNYKGMCLIFEVDEQWWFDVEYITERPSLKKFGKERFEDLSRFELFHLGLMKFTNWKYEREFRRFCPFEIDEYDFVENMHFKKFDDAMKLKGALFGFRSNITKAQIDGIYKSNPDIRLSYTRFSEKYYRVIVDMTRNFVDLKGKHRVKLNSLEVPSYEDLIDEIGFRKNNKKIIG
ncbi:DUF2971 domain-containing protein [Agrobacterium tumefaciens]|uniref:DUF2971 domain-containing protein n=1 Tax=Agrobacterium TaxID=357 RepID=UPI00115DDD68|nr:MULTISPECIES: DUF2971 domain-containing protein [Agrobacterium]MDA5241029.1 DUF2971 domain-containing protein [Agrobacterium sp. MAFF310724]MDA5249739.1 DUF2971 domain-containing protein [Agrobacterium sp. MAFF210268]TRB12254.1 DUF2971 domain-containing protein [Agrobacterium tumefaciens]